MNYLCENILFLCWTSCAQYSFTTDEQLEYNQSYYFPTQAMLPEDFPFHQFNKTANVELIVSVIWHVDNIFTVCIVLPFLQMAVKFWWFGR